MKKTLLEILENNLNSYISGQDISTSLNMTRANVWKEIQKLKNQGYTIDSIRNKGYSLISTNDILNSQRIINTAMPAEDFDVINLKYLRDYSGNVESLVADATAAAEAALVAAGAAFGATGAAAFLGAGAAAPPTFSSTVTSYTFPFTVIV